MNSAATSTTNPDELARLAEQPRVTVRRGGALRADAKCVVYWLQRAMRVAGMPIPTLAWQRVDVGNGP